MNKYKSAFMRALPLGVMMLFLAISLSYGQSPAPDYKNNPEWIKMIDNPNANYYEAIKAYETYWKYHEKPDNEEEEMENNARLNASEKMTEKEKKEMEEMQREKERELKKDAKRKLTEKDLLKLEEKREMTYQCKRFERWLLDVKPFVQNDGRILSQEERMEIYNKQVEEQRKQNNK